MINFVLDWLIFYSAMLIMMCLDNILWIPSGGEFNTTAIVSRKNRVWKGPLRKHFYWVYFGRFEITFPKTLRGLDYIFNYRIMTVLTDWRDITPAIIISFVLTLIF